MKYILSGCVRPATTKQIWSHPCAQYAYYTDITFRVLRNVSRVGVVKLTLNTFPILNENGRICDKAFYGFPWMCIIDAPRHDTTRDKSLSLTRGRTRALNITIREINYNTENTLLAKPLGTVGKQCWWDNCHTCHKFHTEPIPFTLSIIVRVSLTWVIKVEKYWKWVMYAWKR